jgi:Kef-type K+ transport system membrane component KefB
VLLAGEAGGPVGVSRRQAAASTARTRLTPMPVDLSQGLTSLFVVTVVAALAPLIVGLFGLLRVPQVVVLIVGGIVIGPQILGWAEPASIELLSDVGLGFLFLLAGYELELTLFRQRAGRLALVGWLVTAAIACTVVGLLEVAGLVRAFVPVSIALTTTALGTLLPILRDNDMLGGRFGPYVLAMGAVGEFLPIVAIAIFLGANGKFLGLISLCSVGALALVLTLAPRLVRGRVARILHEGQHATAQTTLRWTVVLLMFLLVVANDFGLDVVLGAFLAGVVLRRWAPGDVDALEEKLDAVGYGFFIPVFFVSSGMGLDLRSIGEAPGRLLAFFVLLLAVRGLPTLLVYRSALPLPQRIELTFLAATALPLLVALSEIGLETGTMLPENAAALVGAGVLSVLAYPAAAVAIHRRLGRSRREVGGVQPERPTV